MHLDAAFGIRYEVSGNNIHYVYHSLHKMVKWTKQLSKERHKAIKILNDHFRPRDRWPLWARRLAALKQVNRYQRFTLLLFLLGNGMYPPAVEDFMIWNYYWDEPRRQFYDMSREINRILNAESRTKEYKYWDMNLKREERI